MAQDAVTASDEIIVTGSRIARPEFAFPNPIQSFGSDAIEQSGDVNVTDFLIDTPALVGSISSERNAGSNGFFQSAGLNLLNLRNLGFDRTLVLVDGRRHVAGYPGSASVDINSIPTDLIDRIDILTGGTSAIYGADGVSGVVNFVLKRDFEGVRLRGQSGISGRGDAGNRFASAVGGKNFAGGRANVALAYEYNASDRLNDRDRAVTGDPLRRFELLRDPDEFGEFDDPNVPDQRPFNDIRWADSSPDGAIDTDFDYIPDFTGTGDRYDRGLLLPGSGGRTVGGSGTPTAGYFGDFLPYLARHNVNLLASFEVGPALQIYAEGKFADSTAFTISQPTFDFFTFLSADNPYIPAAIRSAIMAGAGASLGFPDGVFVTRDNLDFGVRSTRSQRETLRGVIGADGRLGDRLRYDISYVRGQSKAATTNSNDRLADRYFAALDAVVDPATGQPTCRVDIDGSGVIDLQNFGGKPATFAPGACVPLNVFGNGVASREALDFISVDHTTRAKITQDVVSGALSGDLGALFRLPGGAVGFALGAEYRKETSRSIPADVIQQGQLLDFPAIAPNFGTFDVKELFGEINVPIVRDAPFAHMLA
ncbi:MAG: TonB-dependent receptor plug domain-containing protein, partial [Pseudomonadota bacterium]|nr:TonB-dependent receptor plug domain-containing protein [Pseudomonadota bacterium]